MWHLAQVEKFLEPLCEKELSFHSTDMFLWHTWQVELSSNAVVKEGLHSAFEFL